MLDEGPCLLYAWCRIHPCALHTFPVCAPGFGVFGTGALWENAQCQPCPQGQYKRDYGTVVCDVCEDDLEGSTTAGTGTQSFDLCCE